MLSQKKLQEAPEAEDVEWQEHKKGNAEKEAQKLAELEACNACIADDAAFNHALTSYKKKDELWSIAGALQISDKDHQLWSKLFLKLTSYGHTAMGFFYDQS